jgi:hypothetical protein
MQLIAPDILIEVRGLSLAVCAIGLAFGLCLWLLGWWGHRFWIVLCTTVMGGIVGLTCALGGAGEPLQSLGSAAIGTRQPFVAALLLAVSAGMLSLALSRVFAFAAGGIAAWLVVRSAMPGWDEPLLCFLVGGLLGLFLFKAWWMALTSLAGTLVMGYSVLGMLDGMGKLDALVWADRRALVLNWACAGVALFGWLIQFFMERWRANRQRQLDHQAELKEAQDELKERFKRRAAGHRWWRWGKEPAKPAGKAA